MIIWLTLARVGNCWGGPSLVRLAGDWKRAVERLVRTLEFLPKCLAWVAGIFSFTRGNMGLNMVQAFEFLYARRIMKHHPLYSFLVGEHMVQSISNNISSVGFYVWQFTLRTVDTFKCKHWIFKSVLVPSVNVNTYDNNAEESRDPISSSCIGLSASRRSSPPSLSHWEPCCSQLMLSW